jgi:hypothetical protein
VFCVPAIIMPTGAVLGSWQGTDSAQPSNARCAQRARPTPRKNLRPRHRPRDESVVSCLCYMNDPVIRFPCLVREENMVAPRLPADGLATRDWTVTDDGTVVCYASEKSHCVVVSNSSSPFVMLEEATLAHDQDLAEVTSKINAILAPLVNKHQKGGRHLCLLNTPRGPLLAWTREGFTRENDEEVLRRIFKFQAA